MGIFGPAGTGKSYIINSLKNIMNEHLLLTASTGKAGVAINGSTIDSILSIPPNRQFKKLGDQAKYGLAKRLEKCSYILIEEVSMIGLKKLGKINDRLQEVGNPEQIFGGFNIIFVGDLLQLPPVMDREIFFKDLKSLEGLKLSDETKQL